jgi:hypothetical protein
VIYNSLYQLIVYGLMASNLVDIRQGSSEDLLIANPNHQSREDSEQEEGITTSDEGGTLRETARERIISTN